MRGSRWPAELRGRAGVPARWVAADEIYGADPALRDELEFGRSATCRWLLVRSHRGTRELAFYRCYAPHPVRPRELVRVAGRRWTVEESFQAGKGLEGLDEHHVRR